MTRSLSQDLFTLIERNFVDPSTTIGELRSDLHNSKLWADSFWRRKTSHENRIDPEIENVLKLNPDSILEIGIAYGRVAAKILRLAKNPIRYTGIEVCKHFQDLFQSHAEYHPELRNVEVLWDNLFKTDLLNDRTFNIILLPMNTLPSFPPIALEKLLEKIKGCIQDDGKFIFSSYKIPESLDEQAMEKYIVKTGSETSKGDLDIIEMEFIQLYLKQIEEGLYSREYHKYTRKDVLGNITEFGIFQSQKVFWKRSQLVKKIESEGFKIEAVDDNSHSLVFVVSIN